MQGNQLQGQGIQVMDQNQDVDLPNINAVQIQNQNAIQNQPAQNELNDREDMEPDENPIVPKQNLNALWDAVATQFAPIIDWALWPDEQQQQNGGNDNLNFDLNEPPANDMQEVIINPVYTPPAMDDDEVEEDELDE